jgi:hypothetical protein
VSRRYASWTRAIAVVLLFQMSSAAAGAPPQEARHHNDRDVVVHFTKWVLDTSKLPFPMAGVVSVGSVTGEFVGEVLEVYSTRDNNFLAIEATYGVYLRNRPFFTALIRDGQNNADGTAILDGVILGGWRTGAPVHVEFRVLDSCAGNPNQSGPLAACLEGTILVGNKE